MSKPFGIRCEWGTMEKPRSLMHPDPEDFDGIRRYVHTGLNEAWLTQEGYDDIPIPWTAAEAISQRMDATGANLTIEDALRLAGLNPDEWPHG